VINRGHSRAVVGRTNAIEISFSRPIAQSATRISAIFYFFLFSFFFFFFFFLFLLSPTDYRRFDVLRSPRFRSFEFQMSRRFRDVVTKDVTATRKDLSATEKSLRVFSPLITSTFSNRTPYLTTFAYHPLYCTFRGKGGDDASHFQIID